MLNGIGLLLMSSLCAAEGSVADAPFVQESHEPHRVGSRAEMNDVRAVAVDAQGNVWAATKAGPYLLKPGTTEWTPLLKEDVAGPTFDIVVDSTGEVWIGAWDGIYRGRADHIERIAGIDAPVAAICLLQDAVVAVAPDGIRRIGKDGVKQEPLPCAHSIRAALADPNGGFWIATGMGLYHRSENGDKLYQSEADILSSDVRGIAFAPDGALWAGGLAGITQYKDGQRTAQITIKDGLPSVYIQSVACGPDGRMWVGTDRGVVRSDGKMWSLRHSKRWLLDDNVRDVAFDASGTAWIATAGGVSAIKQRNITLAEKADFFQRATMERHVREPYLVERCHLPVPGDISKWEPEDDDNDGQYTAMYLVMESFRYAVTKAPDAHDNAKKAFEALRFLQTVTQTPGFFARTVVPASWTKMHDPGDTPNAKEWADVRIQDPRYKPVAERWRKSQDAKWLWKGDTSSDEVTGHFFGYPYYYDLAASDEEKETVRSHVRNIMDYIIEGGYIFKDIDGTHTRWAVWAPERLNGDPDWAAERGINSVEILSYLKTACHVTGDDKYQREYLRLLHEEHYADNVRHAKTYAPAWRTHIDDELLALAFPALLRYEKDPAILQLYQESLDHWYAGVKADSSPFFDYIYASLTGTMPQTNDGIAFLRDAPLDLVNWLIDNTKREDLPLVRAPEIEPLQTSRLMPPSERAVVRWDKNPWSALEGDGGQSEWCPTFWLLPYWMARYYKYIE